MAELPKSVWGRLNPPGLPDQHPDPDLLTAFCEGVLRPVEREQMLAHLAVCAQCREVVALITPAEGPPRSVPKPQRIWLTFPVLRWAAVAATVAVVLAVALLHRPQAPRPILRSDAEVPVSRDSDTSAKVANEGIAEPQAVAPQKESAAVPAVASAPAKPPTNKDRREPNSLTGPAAATARAKATTRDKEIRSKEQPRRSAEPAPPSTTAVTVVSGSGYTDLDSTMKKEKAEQGAIKRDLFDRATNEQTTVHLPSTQAPHGPAPLSQQQMIIQNTAPISPPTASSSGSDQQRKQGPTASAGYVYGGPVVAGAAAQPAETTSAATKQSASAGAPSPAQVTRNANSITPRGSESNLAVAPPPSPKSTTAAGEAGNPVMGAANKTQSGTVDSFTTGGAVHGTLAKALDVRWGISLQGKLLRSVGTAAPQLVTIANDLSFRAVAAIASHVWAGGSQGILYHSGDAGATWKPVPFPTTKDIISIEFSNVRDGLITTSDGQHYATSDGGQNWQVTEGR
jgi:hypothetical protein